MIQTFKEALVAWNTSNGERTKLQHTYIVLIITGVVLAGLVGLLNYNASRTLLQICFAGLGVLVANAVIWALLSSMVLGRLAGQPGASRRK